MEVCTRERLVKLIDEYGSSVCEDPRRCKALLLDVIGNPRDVAVLSAAVNAGVVSDLRSLSSNLPIEVYVNSFAKRLFDESGLSEDLALWSVESWALAMGVVTGDDLMNTIDRKQTPSNLCDEAISDAEYQVTLGESIIERGFLSAESYVEAEKYFRDALSIDPKNQKYQLTLGSCILARELIDGNPGTGKRHDEAMSYLRSAEGYYRKALLTEPSNADLLQKLAESLEGQGKKYESEQFYRRAVALQPGNHEYLMSLVGSLGETDEAEHYLSKAIDVDPENAKSMALMGLWIFNKEEFARALPFLENAINLNPTLIPLLFPLGCCLSALDRHPEAEAYLRKGLRIEPNNAQAHFGLAVALAAQEKFDDSEYHASQSVQLDPTNADARDFASKIKAHNAESSGAGSCFVATACYGSAYAPEVVVLRAYRDRILRRSSMGRAFVNWYYTNGPKLADSIEKKPSTRFLVRSLVIKPFALLAKLHLKTTKDTKTPSHS